MEILGLCESGRHCRWVRGSEGEREGCPNVGVLRYGGHC